METPGLSIRLTASTAPSTVAALQHWLDEVVAFAKSCDFTARRGGIVFSTPVDESGAPNRSGLD